MIATPGIIANVSGPPKVTIISSPSPSGVCGTTSRAISGAATSSPISSGR